MVWNLLDEKDQSVRKGFNGELRLEIENQADFVFLKYEAKKNNVKESNSIK